MAEDFDPALAPPEGYVALVDTDTDWEMSEDEVAAQAPRVDEAVEAPESPVEATDEPEAPEVPEALSEAVEDALEDPEPVAPSGVRETPEPKQRKPYTRGGPADFGGLRQPKDSDTSSESLFRELLAKRTVTVMLDGEAKACGKVRAEDMTKLRKAALNRVVNRILKAGRFEHKYGNSKGCIEIARINAQKVSISLLKAPGFVTPTGRPSVTGKIALAMAENGTQVHSIAADDEYESLVAGADEVDNGDSTD